MMAIALAVQVLFQQVPVLAFNFASLSYDLRCELLAFSSVSDQ